MKLIMSGKAPSRILRGENFISCQEDRKTVKNEVSDIERFKKILNDSNLATGADNPIYIITKKEDTKEYCDQVAATLAAKNESDIKALESKALSHLIQLHVGKDKIINEKALIDIVSEIESLRE